MERLRELRKNKKMTMKDLGAKLNLAESTISLYESGKRQPDLETLAQIANFFNVSIDYLLGKENSTYQKEEQPTPPKKNTIVFFGRGEGKKEFEVSDEEMEAWMKIFENRDKYKNHNDGNF